MKLTDYDAILFDCDGVILNSNQVKTEAFFQAALPYGVEAAKKLVRYHQAHGGISRFQKFKYFLTEIVSTEIHGAAYEALLANYAESVMSGLLNCEIAPGLRNLRTQTIGVPWFIVSGGDQDELKRVFHLRKLEILFDGGIFGSPRSKYEILRTLKTQKLVGRKAVFLGDSKYDYEVAEFFDLSFIFVSNWTDFAHWQPFFEGKEITKIEQIGELVKF